MIFESLRRLIVAVVYIVGLICSFVAGIMAPFQAPSTGAAILFILLGIALLLLTFLFARLVNWIFQH